MNHTDIMTTSIDGQQITFNITNQQFTFTVVKAGVCTTNNCNSASLSAYSIPFNALRLKSSFLMFLILSILNYIRCV